MTPSAFYAKMAEYGDAVITYKSRISGKSKYIVGTLEIKECKYTAEKAKGKTLKSNDKTATVFAWDLDNFKTIDISSVTKVVPLSLTL